MLKILCGLFLGFIVLAGSACVTPTHASSAESIIITSIQAAGPAGARDESVLVYNNSPVEVNVTGWCLVNKSNLEFACLTPTDNQFIEYVLPAYSILSFASEEFITHRLLDTSVVSKVYSVSSQSSGSLVGSADTLKLVDNDKNILDTKSWSAAAPSGKVLSRIKIMVAPDIYANSQTVADWQVVSALEYIENGLEQRELPIEDPVENPIDEPPEVPVNIPEDVDEEIIFEPIITELLPNPAGLDSGQEYIELYNPNQNHTITLSGLRIKIGTDSPKWHDLPADILIKPLSYQALYYTNVPFTLVNTSGQVQLYRGSVFVSDAVAYSAAPEAQSWSYINGSWQYTDQLTPNAANSDNQKNISADEEAVKDSDGTSGVKSEEVKKPCADNQFRNPETGRCKLLTNAETKLPAPCKEGQVRNPETNRCRNATSTISTLSPCKEGQERSPETNRCRNITKMTKADHGVKGVESRNESQSSWYIWLAIAGVGALIIGYGVWEWRAELKSSYQKLRDKFVK